MRNQPLLTPDELAERIDEFHRAVDEYNRGWYFESHETLEDLWMVTPWPERQFFQAIIQLAAAFVHYARREYPGIIKLLDLSLDKLRDFTPQQSGIDVAHLIDDVARARDELAAAGPAAVHTWPESRVPKIAYTHEGSPSPPVGEGAGG